ncbi:hypothetical protein [uncultured Kordia sp.]|uniref:hypothetical protein n=1 Tax=uncultured Kordia sp. TaxID=507699 RepID=UPI00262C6636|nr:hypothetical protein [uncultured Kordia sp.]
MKKQKLKKLQLNKGQVSKLYGGSYNEYGTGTGVGTGVGLSDSCATIFQNTCQSDCGSALRTCISEYGPACGTLPSFEPYGCDVTIATIGVGVSKG